MNDVLDLIKLRSDVLIVKNTFGFTILYCTVFNVDYKFYGQVLTPVNNSQLLLKLEILDKFRLVTNHESQHKGT